MSVEMVPALQECFEDLLIYWDEKVKSITYARTIIWSEKKNPLSSNESEINPTEQTDKNL